MEPVLMFFADSHLRIRRGDEQFALKQIVDAAVRRKLPLIGAGDLIDKQSNRAGPIVDFNGQLDRLAKNNIPFYYIQGQHELDTPPWLSAHAWPQHLHQKEIEIGGLSIYGLDFLPSDLLKTELAEIPTSARILVCHQVWADWMGSIAVPQAEFSDVAGHIEMLISGDYHSWQNQKARNADGRSMVVVSPGATTQQKVDEPSTHYYGLLYRDMTVKRVALKSRRFIDWPIMNRPEDLEKFVQDFNEILSNEVQIAVANDYPPDLLQPLMRVTHSYKLEDAQRRVLRLVDGRARVVFKELLPERSAPVSRTVVMTDGEPAIRPDSAPVTGPAVTPLSALHDELDSNAEPDTYALVERLLLAEDPELEFSNWQREVTR